MKRPSLNHTYRLVWNDQQGAYVAVAESAKGRGKSGKSLLVAALVAPLLAPALASAAPSGGVVTSGSAAISQGGTTTTINQSSQKATINWQGFSIAGNETVNFNQPSSSAMTLNRVIGNEKSIIEGALNANGKIFLVNSNGVLFGQGASVNVGGLVASTLSLSDDDFNAGNYVFKANGSGGSIINLGTITAKDGGYVALLGNNVSNQGLIAATKGTIALSAGEKITLNFNGDSLLSVTIDEGTLNALVENKKAIVADGGAVFLTAKAADELLGAQVNNSGVIQARTIEDLKGKIELYAHSGTANVDGTLDASAPTGGDGGFVETSGDKVKITDGAVITTKSAAGQSGTWLIDPTNFTVSSGSGAQTASGIGASTLSANLENGNVSIVTAASGSEEGDINVNAAVSWSSDKKLTLTAADDININAAITASKGSLELNAGGTTPVAGNDIYVNAPITLGGASSQLTMNYGGDYYIRTKASYSGTERDSGSNPVAKTDNSGGVYGSITFTNAANTNGLLINGSTYTLIHTMNELAAISGVSGNHYALADHIDAVGTYSSAVVANFSGTLTGLGHSINNLSITKAYSGSDSTPEGFGLIGIADANSLLRDIGVSGVSISVSGISASFKAVGGLVGITAGNIKNAYATGSINVAASSPKLGGLVGYSNASSGTNTISDVFADVDIISSYGGFFGGLIGRAENLNVYRANAFGGISAPSNAGGLLGYIKNSNVYSSYATGSIIGSYYDNGIGGLIGTSTGNTQATYILDSFATGNVSGIINLGGLVGSITNTNANVVLRNVWASGSVIGSGQVGSNYPGIGGLIGFLAVDSNDYTVNVTNAHASGEVRFTGSYGTAAGCLIGAVGTYGSYVVTNSYATGNVKGGTSSGNAGGLIGQTNSLTNVSNSYATGDVWGYTSTGGLLGNNAGTVTNSWASGNVTGARTQAGGLVGANTGTIANSRATGQVSGLWKKTYTGGVVGSNGGTVINSFSTGLVAGPAPYVGGVAGINFGSGAVINSYFNADKNSSLKVVGEFVPVNAVAGRVEASGGLGGPQLLDIAYYAAGTIEQVRTERAERAAFEQSSVQIAANEVAQAGKRAAAPSAEALRGGGSGVSSQLDQNIVFSDRSTFSADVRRIEVDGKVFLLDDEGEEGASK